MPNRQLAVYDSAMQPTLGEFCIFLQASLSLSARLNIDDVDLCIVADPAGIMNPDFFPLKTNDGALRGKVFELLPMTLLHPKLRNLFVVDRLEYAVTLARQTDTYNSCWPPSEMIKRGRYNYYSDLVLLDRLYHGRPVESPLGARPVVADWAKKFLANHCRGNVPVTVNLRNNPTHCVHRNMLGHVWREFFDQAESRHPATFFILGAASEDFSIFRTCRNVVITKDAHTSAEQDLALIEYASIHMGSTSGPSIFPLFIGDKPSLIVNTDAVRDLHNYHGSLALDGDILRFAFGNRNYRSTAAPETTAFLSSEFSTMLAALIPDHVSQGDCSLTGAQMRDRESRPLRIGSSPTRSESIPNSGASTLEAACAKAMELQLTGNLSLADQLYRVVLQAAPQHAAANYGLGMLHVQLNKPLDGLPYLKTALLAKLEVPDFWLGYLEALLLLARNDEAKHILRLGRQHSLEGSAVDEFESRLERSTSAIILADPPSQLVG